VPLFCLRKSKIGAARARPPWPAAESAPEPAAAAPADELRELRRVAEQVGSCGAPATEADLQALVGSLRGSGDESEGTGVTERAGARAQGQGSPASLHVQQPAVPAAVQALWREASSWHFSHDHCEVFGFNIYSPGSVKATTVQIFGDWECRDDWRVDLQRRQPEHPSVAERGWLCIGAASEFDYLFCCFDSASPQFGHVRHMVNNCCEEWACCADALLLVRRLLAWHASGADEDSLLDSASPRPVPPARASQQQQQQQQPEAVVPP
jgi:hypothetical protein